MICLYRVRWKNTCLFAELSRPCEVLDLCRNAATGANEVFFMGGFQCQKLYHVIPGYWIQVVACSYMIQRSSHVKTWIEVTSNDDLLICVGKPKGSNIPMMKNLFNFIYGLCSPLFLSSFQIGKPMQILTWSLKERYCCVPNFSGKRIKWLSICWYADPSCRDLKNWIIW